MHIYIYVYTYMARVLYSYYEVYNSGLSSEICVFDKVQKLVLTQ